MKLESLSLTLALAVFTAPALTAMHYTAPNTPILVSVPAVPLNPLTSTYSTCSSASNTIAVGFEYYLAGFRMLCADAGRIGFWTTPVEDVLVGQQSQTVNRFLCPSGTALTACSLSRGCSIRFLFAAN